MISTGGDAGVRGKALLLTVALCFLLFWSGLGFGSNMSDVRYWVDSTRMMIWLEWAFIVLYLSIVRNLSAFSVLWKRHRLNADLALLWGVAVVLSYLFSPYYGWQNILAQLRLFETFTHALFFFMLWDAFQRYNIDYRWLFAALIASTLIVLVYFVYIHFSYPQLRADSHVFSIRSEQLLLNTHLHRIGYQVATVLILLTAFLSTGKRGLLVLSVMTVLLLFMFWLGGRAALLGTAVALLFYVYLVRNGISIKRAFLPFVLPAVIMVAAVYFQWVDTGYIVNAFQKTFLAGSLEGMMTGRYEVWGLAFEKLEGHWLLGTGPQSYFFYPQRHAEVIHAHNFILQFLGEWGILGTVPALLLLLHGLRYGMQMHGQMTADARALHRSAGLAMLALGVMALFGGIFFFHQTELYFMLLMAVWITPLKQA